MLTQEEISDLNSYIYGRLRREFGTQVDSDWCRDLTVSIVEESNRIKKASTVDYYVARNRKLAEIMKRR